MSPAYCMSAANIVCKLAVSRNRRWPYNHKVFARQKEQLQSSVADMIEVHRQFLETLSHDHAEAMNKNLTEIGHLHSKLYARMAQIDMEWASSKPDEQSIAVSVYEIRTIADEWRSEHKQMASAMNLSQQLMTRRNFDRPRNTPGRYGAPFAQVTAIMVASWRVTWVSHGPLDHLVHSMVAGRFAVLAG